MSNEAGQEAPGSTHTNARDAWAIERQRLAQEVENLRNRYDERLANQRQVIESLSEARHALLAANADYESFARYVADDFTGDHDLSVKARELLNRREP